MNSARYAPSPFAVALAAVAVIVAAVAWLALEAHLARDEQQSRCELSERNLLFSKLDLPAPPTLLAEPWQPPRPTWDNRDADLSLNLHELGDFGPPVTNTRPLPLWRADPPTLQVPRRPWRLR